MADVINKIYEIGFSIWQIIMNFAINLFKMDLKMAGTSSYSGATEGKLYAMTHLMYLGVQDIAIPIAIVFFLIAIIKDVTSCPPDQQAKRFFHDALKFGVMVGILANLWEVLGYVMQIATGFTDAIYEQAKLSTSSSVENASIYGYVTELCSQSPSGSFFNDPAGWIAEFCEILMEKIAMLVAAFITCLAIISASFSIMSSAYQRILKPLVVMPFASIAVAMAAGSSEGERIANSYLKTFFGLCLSGAFMVIAVSLGNVFADSDILQEISGADTAFGQCVCASLQCAVTPTVIAGLVKGADSMLGRFF
jgi:hypothetical protein